MEMISSRGKCSRNLLEKNGCTHEGELFSFYTLYHLPWTSGGFSVFKHSGDFIFNFRGILRVQGDFELGWNPDI